MARLVLAQRFCKARAVFTARSRLRGATVSSSSAGLHQTKKQAKLHTSLQMASATSALLDFGLKGVHVLVTGASGGIGQDIVACFRSLGCLVTAQFNTDPRGLEMSDDLAVVKADVATEDGVQYLFDEAMQKHHGQAVQVLVANHGIFPTDSVMLCDMTLAQWRRTHAVNLEGTFLLCREYMLRLRNIPSNSALLDAASICIIGSTAGKFGEADHGDYASTKAALMYGLVPSLKNELVRIAPKGRVNAVNPGWTATPMALPVIRNEKVRARALASTPLQKVAKPIDIARQVAVISSPQLSGHVSGVNLQVDGGMEGRCLFPPPT